jgi:hypothetical protein
LQPTPHREGIGGIVDVPGELVIPHAAPGMGARLDHALMGGVFGLAHLAYGVYLYVTDPRKTTA